MAILSRITNAWNAFRSQKEENYFISQNIGPSSTARNYITRPRYVNERSIVSSIYNRISIDVASIEIRHVKIDDIGRYSEDINDSLNS